MICFCQKISWIGVGILNINFYFLIWYWGVEITYNIINKVIVSHPYQPQVYLHVVLPASPTPISPLRLSSLVVTTVWCRHYQPQVYLRVVLSTFHPYHLWSGLFLLYSSSILWGTTYLICCIKKDQKIICFNQSIL